MRYPTGAAFQHPMCRMVHTEIALLSNIHRRAQATHTGITSLLEPSGCLSVMLDYDCAFRLASIHLDHRIYHGV